MTYNVFGVTLRLTQSVCNYLSTEYQSCWCHYSSKFRFTLHRVAIVQQSSARSVSRTTPLMIRTRRKKTRGWSSKHAEEAWLHCRQRCYRWLVSWLLQRVILKLAR